jgi:hypothetical protein
MRRRWSPERRSVTRKSSDVRGKDYNTGLRGVLFEARHFERMGSAVWLYGWLVLRQTHQSGGVGWVLGGAPVCYREIEEETGFNRRTLERWMHMLRRSGYIQTEAAPGGVVIRITKAKKFAHPPRGIAEGVRRGAGAGTRDSVADCAEGIASHKVTDGIGSSSVERLREITEAGDFHSNFHRSDQRLFCSNSESEIQKKTATANPFSLGKNENQRSKPEIRNQLQPASEPNCKIQQQQNFSQESRVRFQLLRTEREEAVRRELNVGAGPELRRS